jgi:hypothetical protein
MKNAARRVTLFLVLLALIPLAYVGYRWDRSGYEPPALPESRIPELKLQLERQRHDSAAAVAAYRPKVAGIVDDLDLPAEPLLRQLPGVVRVERSGPEGRPQTRIVHVRDWHFVPRDLYALDMRTAWGRDLTDAEIDRLHEELLLEVELVQEEQLAMLRCLVKYHGLKKIYSEGLTPAGLANYREIIKTLKKMETDEVPSARKQLAEVRELLAGMGDRGQEDTERYRAAAGIEAQLAKMIDDHRHRLLEFGAAGRLLIAGELEEVVPLDDETALDSTLTVNPH